MHRRVIYRWAALAVASLVLAVFGGSVGAQEADFLDSIQRVQNSIDTAWVLLAGFLVFFMQAGFAMLEAGFTRQTGVVNILMENLVDASVTAILFWVVGFGIAFGTDDGSGLIGTDNFFLAGTMVFENGTVTYAGDGLNTLTLFFFQFAFAATASTIATGAMAERTDFLGNLVYTGLVSALIYPIVVHWVWGGGWLAQRGFLDFAGSTVVHTVGGVIGLVGAALLGPRKDRVFGRPPRPHNLSLATLGALILWLGWYGFNPGSTFGTGDTGLMALVTVNTTLAAAAGTLATMFYVYARSGVWDISYAINGTLGGLVAITAGCAFMVPWAAVVVGLTAGTLVVVVMQQLESFEIDDAVGAFAVHGSSGIVGTLAIGFLAQPELTNGAGGLLLGGGVDQLLVQVIGSGAVVTFIALVAFGMFRLIKAMGRLRIPDYVTSIDLYEHRASNWPDVWHGEDELKPPTERTTDIQIRRNVDETR